MYWGHKKKLSHTVMWIGEYQIRIIQFYHGQMTSHDHREYCPEVEFT